MKKLIVMLGVCAIACASQAMAFKWSATNVRIPVANDVTKDQTGIKVTSSSTAFDANALTLNLFWVDSKGVEKSVESSPNAGGASLALHEAFTDESAIFSTIIDDNGGEAVKFVLRADYITKDGSYAFYQDMTKDISGLKDTNVSAVFNMANGSWNYTAAAVPEPTSGLLLLLGVAGLALRRRRA